MPKLSLWNSGRRSFDFSFIDKNISEYINISGTAVYVHLYIGPHQQLTPMLNADGSVIPALDPNNPPTTPINGNITSIQDVLLLENRDRKYSDVVYEMRGCYNLADIDYDMRQFGLFLTGDTLFLEFHLNDMIAMIGRRLMNGDVVELPHRRDDTIDINAPAVNKFYVVEDASRPAAGYSQTWWPHLWRVKISPMPASQEYQDILNKQQTNPLGFLDNGTIGSLMTTIGFDMGINEAVVEQAKLSVPKRYFETQQYYIVLPETNEPGYPFVFAGDGIPPNGAIPILTGKTWPAAPADGDYVLRTDYAPATLFMWSRGMWRMQEQDHRGNDWSAAHRLLLEFIKNNKQSTFQDGTTAPEKQALSRALKPTADF
jgi:hypothetical protein